MMFSRICRVMCGLMLVPVCVEAAGVKAASWHRLATDDFSIFSDASPKDMEEFAVTYAAFRHVVQERLVGPGTKLPGSVIVLFRREETFHEYAKESIDKTRRTTAVTSEIDGTALTALSLAEDRDQAMTTLFEFETIWMLPRVGIWAPLWMSQGAGEVLSTLRVSKGRYRFGEDNARFIQPLEHDAFFPWLKFFSINHDSPEYRGDTSPGVYHGQAWALMHWVLFSKEEGRERFIQLATKMKSGLAIPAIEEVMGVPEAKFVRAIRDGMYSNGVWLPFDDKAVRSAWRIEPVSEVELHVQLAEVLAASGKTVEADGELGQAQLLAPAVPIVLEARARQALRKNDKDEAAALYRRSIEAGTKNPRAYLQSAQARLNGSSVNGNTDYPGGGGNNVTTALGEIRQALELSPGIVEAYEAMGRAFFLAPQITEADVVELSRGIGPGRVRVKHYRALLWERLEKYDDSIADFRAVIADPDCSPQLRHSSEQRIASVIFTEQRHQIETMVKAKQFDEAHALLTSAKRDNPGAADQYDRLSIWMSERERTVVLGDLRRDVDRLLAAKKFDEARASVNTTLGEAKSPVLAKEREKLLASVEESAALQHLTDLYQGKQWTEFHMAVQDFFQRFPKSGKLASLRRSDEQAQKMQAQKPESSVSPAVEPSH